MNIQPIVAGMDEVGMGCLAGPLMVAVVAFPQGQAPIPGVRDSKTLSKKQRAGLNTLIRAAASYVGVGSSRADFIDDYGLVAAWQAAAHQALNGNLYMDLLIDGERLVSEYKAPQRAIVRGDSSVWQIGAASIVAKVAKDTFMEQVAIRYPGYGWERNSGYGTKEHFEAVERLGYTPLHRLSYLKKRFGDLS